MASHFEHIGEVRGEQVGRLYCDRERVVIRNSQAFVYAIGAHQPLTVKLDGAAAHLQPALLEMVVAEDLIETGTLVRRGQQDHRPRVVQLEGEDRQVSSIPEVQSEATRPALQDVA